MSDAPNTDTPRVTMTVREASAVLGLSENSIYAHINAGHLPVVMLGARKLIRRDVLDRVLQEGLPRLPPVAKRRPAQAQAQAEPAPLD
ncbi:helix-turn-helix domain protein [Microcystis phage MJing1]|nr:helix-turn-helix domain protein [Microcystis phage MJing1]